jgi:hypothetical protein
MQSISLPQREISPEHLFLVSFMAPVTPPLWTGQRTQTRYEACVFLSHSPSTLSLRQGLLLNLEFADSARWTACKLQNPPSYAHWAQGLQAWTATANFLLWIPETQFRFSCLHGQALYQLNHLLSLQVWGSWYFDCRVQVKERLVEREVSLCPRMQDLSPLISSSEGEWHGYWRGFKLSAAFIDEHIPFPVSVRWRSGFKCI